MDPVFHIASSAWLARRLGERRIIQLMLAGLIGIIPDIAAMIWRSANLPETYPSTASNAYPLSHSLVFNIPVFLLLFWYNRRIAWGALLHIGVDVLAHRYATSYLLYPFMRIFVPVSLVLHFNRQFVKIGFWILLVLLIYSDYRRVKKSGNRIYF